MDTIEIALEVAVELCYKRMPNDNNRQIVSHVLDRNGEIWKTWNKMLLSTFEKKPLKSEILHWL